MYRLPESVLLAPQRAVENARVLAAQAKEAGIIIEHKPYDWGIFYADVKSSNVELYTLRWVGVTDPHVYYENFHSSQIGKGNRSRIKHAELDKMIEAGENTLDRNERKKYYDKVQEIMADEMPFVSLWYPSHLLLFFRLNL
jgi:peptide/nickel transport system substrate-binding protein